MLCEDQSLKPAEGTRHHRAVALASCQTRHLDVYRLKIPQTSLCEKSTWKSFLRWNTWVNRFKNISSEQKKKIKAIKSLNYICKYKIAELVFELHLEVNVILRCVLNGYSAWVRQLYPAGADFPVVLIMFVKSSGNSRCSPLFFRQFRWSSPPRRFFQRDDFSW